MFRTYENLHLGRYAAFLTKYGNLKNIQHPWRLPNSIQSDCNIFCSLVVYFEGCHGKLFGTGGL